MVGWLRDLVRRRKRRRLEADVRAEMRAHISLCTEDRIAEGMEPERARREAERRFGDLDRLVATGADAKYDPDHPLGRFPGSGAGSPATVMRDFVDDVRYALRTLRDSPVFSLVAVLSLAIGIGFNVTMFSVVDTVLFKPFPADDPDRVVRVRTAGQEFGDLLMSYPDYRDLRESTASFSSLEAARLEMTTLAEGDRVEFAFGEAVSINYFGMLGIPPLRGRTFTPEEEIEGNHRVVMVSESFWRDRLGGEPGALGRQLKIGGASYTVIGVVPGRYSGLVPPIEVSFWVPSPATRDFAMAGTGSSAMDRRGSHSYYVIGRLAEGVTVEQAAAEVAGVAEQLAREHPETNADKDFTAVPASDVRIDPVADRAMVPAAGVLLGLVGMILLLACANVANMMLARGTVRRQEIGVRMALGAGRWRLIRQLLTESLVLSLLGGVLAVLMARLALQILLAVQPPVMVPVSFAIEIGPRVWLFTFVVAILTAGAFGLLPALRSTRSDLSTSLRGEAASECGRARGSRLRDGLVVVQVTVSLVLLIAASLMVRSLQSAQSIDPGISTDSIVSVSPGLVVQGYDRERARDFHLRALERIAGLPGVTDVAFAERLPIDPTVMTREGVYAEDRDPDDRTDPPGPMVAAVDPAYFDLLGIEIVRGRGFEETDVRDAPMVAIVNDVLAEVLWPGRDPIGRHLAVGAPDGPRAEVVGVHAPHKVSTLGEEPTPNLYLPYAQYPGTGFGNLLARVEGDPGPALEAMRGVLLELDPDLAVLEVETLRQHLSLSLFPIRLAAAALGLLGLVGGLLAAVGVYGVVAFSVARRTREIGIRLAVGADRSRVVRLILRQGMRLILIGATLGLAIALLSTRALSAMLYGISATDGVAYAAGALVLIAIGLVANAIPALRAAHVDPTTALRAD